MTEYPPQSVSQSTEHHVQQLPLVKEKNMLSSDHGEEEIEERTKHEIGAKFDASKVMPHCMTTTSMEAIGVPVIPEARSSSFSYCGDSANFSFRGRPIVDVIATYMNTSDTRVMKTDLLRASGTVFLSPRNQNRVRTSSALSKESSADWGWFADIDSSSESWGADGSLQSLRRKLSVELGLVDSGNAVHVLGDEQANTRITAAHKTFTIVIDGKQKVVSGTISIPKFRIVQSRSGTDRHAQYLITFKLGKDFYADWRRYSEFGELAKTLPIDKYERTLSAWKSIDTRWFNRLEPSYLHQKCITLENFMRELMYESSEAVVLINFLGGFLGKVNTRPTNPIEYRPSAQLPKEMRPPQPRHERELFERMWAENFKRSCVNYTSPPLDKTQERVVIKAIEH